MKSNEMVKEGYKQTEIGVLPGEWEVLPLKGVLLLQRGYDLPSRNRIPGEIPIVSSSGVIDFHNEMKTKGPGVVTGRYGTIGDIYFIQDDFWPLNTTLFASSFNNNDPQFVYYLLHTIDFDSHSGKSGVPGVNRNDLHKLRTILPPLPEQRAIAAVLSDLDALIASLDRLIAKKRDIKQATMQQLLTGQTRLPGFDGEWEVKRIFELGEVVTGGTPPTKVKDYWGEGFPWVTPTDISNKRDIFNSDRTITSQGLERLRTLPANTLLVTCIASIGKNVILRKNGGCNQQINAIIINDAHKVEFLYYLIEQNSSYLMKNAGRTATQILSKSTFSNLTFRVPPLPEQTAIATILSDMDAEIEALQARRDKTRQLKQGMMQELLTGKTRLKWRPSDKVKKSPRNVSTNSSSTGSVTPALET